MTDHTSGFIAVAHPTASAKSSSERLRSNSYEINTTKRVRAGSISGRLRAASDLEESGFIDKHQKGLIKDLIISGDVTLQHMLDKYERGDRQELLDLIQAGYLGKQNVDILDGLDFDFLNNFPMDDPSGDEHVNLGLHPEAEVLGPVSKTAPTGHHVAHGTHRVPSSDERHRRESIDSLYMQDLLHDDFHVFHHPSHSHDSGEHDTVDANVFGRIFNHFKEEGDRKAVRKSIRLEEGDVDLSAYATLAASLAKKGPTPAAGSLAKPVATTGPVGPIGSMVSPTAGLRGTGPTGGILAAAAASSSSSSSAARPNPSPSTSSTLLNPSSKPVYYTASGQELVLPADAKALGYVGAYSPEQRKERILKFLEKRQRRVWTKKVKYDVRKNFADSRMRIKGRFVKKEDEDIMRELMAI